MPTAYIGKCRYEIQEQKAVPVWYTDTGCTGPFREIFSMIKPVREKCGEKKGGENRCRNLAGKLQGKS
jgi:hypothetical protein